MSNVWFLGDLHRGHKNIYKYRDMFATVEDHDDYLEEQYHKYVTKRDTVFFLGDTAFTEEALERVGSWHGEQKILIAGNHDLDKIPMSTIVKYYDKVYALLRYKSFWLSHAPIHPAELRGKFNIHGHVHANSIDDPRYLNCSLENIDFRPISLLEVRKHFNIEK